MSSYLGVGHGKTNQILRFWSFYNLSNSLYFMIMVEFLIVYVNVVMGYYSTYHIKF